MNITNMLENVLSILMSTGIIYIAVNLTASRIEKHLEASYQLKLDKELEKYKNLLDQKNYISKTRFDTEFTMHQELSEKHISVVYDAGETVLLVRMATESKIEPNEMSAHIEKFCQDINNAEITTKRYAPFISSEMYEKYIEIDKKSAHIFDLLKTWNSIWTDSLPKSFNLKSENGEFIAITQTSIKQEIEREQKELSSLLNVWLNSLREYLSNLDVLEGK